MFSESTVKLDTVLREERKLGESGGESRSEERKDRRRGELDEGEEKGRGRWGMKERKERMEKEQSGRGTDRQGGEE